MKKQTPCFAAALWGLLLFALYTRLLLWLDVAPIGPGGSVIGCATLNGAVHTLLGVDMTLYTLTDWGGLGAVIVAFGFAVLGLVQLIRRRSLWRVDHSLLVLGCFYLCVIGAYLYFEMNAINYRPVLIEGRLEASYPSSTTLLVLCVGCTAMQQFGRLLRGRAALGWANALVAAYMGAMVLGRLLSGVHWLTDILGGVLLSAALVSLYRAAERWAQARWPQ